MRMRMDIVSLAMACLLSVVCAAQARVGESVKQSEARYGGAGTELDDAEHMILANARNIVYYHGDWIITAASVNDVTLRIRYEKATFENSRTRLSKEDVQEILEAEDAEGWTAFNERTRKTGKAYTGKGHPPPMLKSASGLTARYRVFSVIVDNPQAARHEAGLLPQQPVRRSAGQRVAL
ncbi:MAG: hypothetical protein ACOX7Q_13795 [Kiritimatiellia bacterium]|jgi:hypothetical protein